MKKIISLSVFVLLVGCSLAGPFVTSISSDGNNGLIIEKCDVKFDGFLGVVSNENCRTTNVKLRD